MLIVLLKKKHVKCVWTSGLSDLVALWSDHNDYFKGLAFAEGHIMDLLLWAPGLILTRVENHLVPSVKSRVDVEGDVAGLRLSTAQVDMKPAKSNSRTPETLCLLLWLRKRVMSQLSVRKLKKCKQWRRGLLSLSTNGLKMWYTQVCAVFVLLMACKSTFDNSEMALMEKEEWQMAKVEQCVASLLWYQTTAPPRVRLRKVFLQFFNGATRFWLKISKIRCPNV